MKWLALGLLLLLALSQFRLWFSEQGSIAELTRLEGEIARQEALNVTLSERNARLEQEVVELKQGLETVEERARQDLGMIREGETYYQVIEPQDADKSREQAAAVAESKRDD